MADPDLVPHSVAVQLGLREQPARPLVDPRAGCLRPRQALIVLDPSRAMRLAGAAAALRETVGSTASPAPAKDHG